MLTPSMRVALHDLRLDRIDVVHPGSDTFAIAPKVRALALADLDGSLPPGTSARRRR